MAATQDRSKYGASKGPVNRLGTGLVPLGAPKRTKSSHKLAVPKPVNLPSLKKAELPQENAGNDPTTQLVPSGQSGWTAKGEEQERGGAASIVERSTWASAEPPRLQQPPLPAWQRTGTLNPMDFPSLAASAKGQQAQQHVRPLPEHQAGNWDEDEREHSYGPRSSPLERGDAGGRDGALHRMDQAGFGGRGSREGELGAGYGRDGRYTPSEGPYERGHYREGPQYSREGGYGRDNRQDWEDRYGRELYPLPCDRPLAYNGGQRSQRHENGGRWSGGSEPFRRRGSEDFAEEYSRGDYGLLDDGYDGRPPRYERPPRQQYPPLSSEYDPELFPPMPASGSEPERLRPSIGERDHEREAFNAELERVAAELDEKRQPGHGRMEDGRGPYAGRRSEGAESSDDGEQASYAARAGSHRGVQEGERPRWEGPAWKLREAEDRMPLQEGMGMGHWEDMAQREEMAQRRARELADAQAAAYAALSKPAPAGAEPAFERRPPPNGGFERRPEPRGSPPPVIPPPPPPPPRQPPTSEQHAPSSPPAIAPRVHAAPVPPPAGEAPAPEVAYVPAPQPPQLAGPRPSIVEQQPMPSEQRSVLGPPSPSARPAPAPAPRAPRASGRHDQAAPSLPVAQQQAQRDGGGAAPPASAPASPRATPPVPAPQRSSLVKPGASWRSVLSGMPDGPPQAAPSDEQQPAARQRVSSASAKGAASEGKRGKGRGTGRAAAGGPVVEAVPEASPAAAETSAAKGKRGKSTKGQRVVAAVAAQAGPVPEQQPAQAQRGGRRQLQKEQKEGAAGTAGSRSGRSGTKGRGRGAKASQGQPVEVAAGAGVAAAVVHDQLPHQEEEPSLAPLPVGVHGEERGLTAMAAPADGDALGAAMGAASSAAAFGWSSPLADEVAKLQLSAGAELAAEVAASAAVVSAGMGLGAPMALLDSDLLEPPALQDISARAVVALDPRGASPPPLGQEGETVQPLPSANPLADLLGDDVITALPADLTLDLAGEGSSAETRSTAVSSGFALPPPQQASPPPFPGGLFPLPAMAVGGPNPWQPSPALQEPGVSVPGLAAAAQSLYSLAQQPHITFGTHIPITSTQPPTLPGPEYGRQQQQQAAAAAAVAAFGQQAASLQFSQPGSFLMQPAAFIPTGKQPDWSTPQGRTASPVPLPSYSMAPQSQPQGMDGTMLPYGVMPVPGVYGRGLPGAPMPLSSSMQYPHQHQQTSASHRPGFAPSPPPPPSQQQPQYDPAAALPDDVFWEGSASASLLAPGPAASGGPQGRRGPRQDGGGRGGRLRYDGGMPTSVHPQQMGPPPMFMMNGLPGRGAPAAYGGRGGIMPPGMPRQQHMMGGGMGRQGQGMPPPPPEGGGGRGARPRAGRAGRSGRGANSGGGPQQAPTKNVYVQQQGAGMAAGQRSSSGGAEA